MKKIYLMGLTAAFAMSVNAQTTIKIKNPRANEGKTVQNSTAKVAQVACTIVANTQYVAGTTMNLNFTYQTVNTDLEYVDYLAITFPAGIVPTGAANTSNPFPNTEDAGGGLEALNPPVGQVISWGVDNNDTYGGIYSSTGINFTVNVTISAGLIGNQTATFDASGDGYGAAPGNQIGSTFIIYPAGAAIVNMQTKFVIPNNATAVNNCALGTGTIIARVVNMGNNAASNIPANYSVNGVASAPIVIPGPIAPGDSATFSFPAPYNFAASDVYKIKAWTSLPLDVNLANDTAVLSIVNSIPTPLSTADYINGIESNYDFASIYQSWLGSGLAFGQSFGTFRSGVAALFYTISAGAPAATYETFNVLPCMDVTSSEIYKISYWRKANTSGTLTVNGQSGVFTGTVQNAASMTTVLKAYSAITPNPQAGVWQKDSTYYTATANETRYFAIGGKGTIATASDQINVRIDDIKITKEGTVGIKTNSSIEAISMFPNPTSGILNVTSVEVTSSIEVFNVIGEKVYSHNLVKGNNVVDLSGLSNGAYFVKMNSNNQLITKKVVLSK